MKNNKLFTVRRIAFYLLSYSLSYYYFAEADILKIAFYAPSDASLGHFDLCNLNKEISGSEYNILELAQELSRNNCQVSVYSNPVPNSDCTLETSNPRFFHASTFMNQQTNNDFDIIMVYRYPWFIKEVSQKLRDSRVEKVPLLYFWPMDYTLNRFEDQYLDNIKNIFWSSKAQKDSWTRSNHKLDRYNYILGHGADISFFGHISNRQNPYSCIYASSYDRGLNILLDCWPTIKDEYPKAVLNIYFGGRTWTSPAGRALTLKIKNMAIYDVIEHGWVTSTEIIKAYENASFWTYPCTFDEMFCLSGVKAQIAGAIPVIYNRAALNETVLSGYICSSKEPYLDLLRKAFSQAENISLRDRENVSNKVKEKWLWSKIADRLIQLFKQDMQ